MKNFRLVLGFILIILGLIILLNQFLNLNIQIWPLILIIGGIFLASKTDKSTPGVLIPATYSFLLGIFFIFQSYTNWRFSDKNWPTYILIGGISFFTTYLYSKDKNYLFPSFGLIILSAFFYSIALNNKLIISAILIVCGLFFIISSLFKNKI